MAKLTQQQSRDLSLQRPLTAAQVKDLAGLIHQAMAWFGSDDQGMFLHSREEQRRVYTLLQRMLLRVE